MVIEKTQGWIRYHETKAGKTLAREYGDKFKAKICLSDFVDLSTGKWISK